MTLCKLSFIFSLKSRYSFLDSFASVKPVINGKLKVNTKNHMEISQLVIVSQNFEANLILKSLLTPVKGAKNYK